MHQLTDRAVLLVEDDRAMRSLLCDELEDLGVQVVEAGDGDEAVQVAINSSPALILTDLWMPKGGLGYIARLRSARPTCPIIVCTGYGDAQTQAQILAAGAVAYFDKPVKMAVLTTTVLKILHEK